MLPPDYRSAAGASNHGSSRPFFGADRRTDEISSLALANRLGPWPTSGPPWGPEAGVTRLQFGGHARACGARAQQRTFGYQPALDGVRALAIVLVLLFHLGYDWMPGGYLGVSVFFTLSGFLITSLLLDERSRQRFDPGASVLRPPGPAPAAGFARVPRRHLACSSPWACRRWQRTPRSDIVGALLQVTNWHGSSPTSPTPTCSDRRHRSPTSGRWRSRSSSTGSGRWRWRP